MATVMVHALKICFDLRNLDDGKRPALEELGRDPIKSLLTNLACRVQKLASNVAHHWRNEIAMFAS